MFGIKIKWNEWCDKIRDLEEGMFSMVGEDNYYYDNVNQVVVERYVVVLDMEQIQWIGYKLWEIVEQNIINMFFEEDVEEVCIE